MAISERKAIIVGISGASSSGKTTLSRLLRDIFPNTFVLHEDDFYKPETELPMKYGLHDWDCAEALEVPDMVKTLDYIQRQGTFPPNFDSKEDRNSVGEIPISKSVVTDLKALVLEWTQPGHHGHGILTSNSHPLRLCILDGFLLYSPSMVVIQPHIDIKLFLRVSYEKARARREARDGYATLEGWWKDPPGYVDKIVWPNYVNDHKWMFDGEDVGSNFDKERLKEWRINCQADKGPDVDFETTLRWAVDTVMKQLEKLSVRFKAEGHVHA